MPPSKILATILGKNYDIVGKKIFKLDGYNRLGLYYDDLREGNGYNEEITEAYRRILIDNPVLHDERVARVLRAIQLDIQKKELPPEQWTTYEEDNTKGRYLTKYLKQIEAEEKEKAEWIVKESS